MEKDIRIKNLIALAKKHLNDARYAELHDIFAEIDLAYESLKEAEKILETPEETASVNRCTVQRLSQ